MDGVALLPLVLLRDKPAIDRIKWVCERRWDLVLLAFSPSLSSRFSRFSRFFSIFLDFSRFFSIFLDLFLFIDFIDIYQESVRGEEYRSCIRAPSCLVDSKRFVEWRREGRRG